MGILVKLSSGKPLSLNIVHQFYVILERLTNSFHWSFLLCASFFFLGKLLAQ